MVHSHGKDFWGEEQARVFCCELFWSKHCDCFRWGLEVPIQSGLVWVTSGNSNASRRNCPLKLNGSISIKPLRPSQLHESSSEAAPLISDIFHSILSFHKWFLPAITISAKNAKFLWLWEKVAAYNHQYNQLGPIKQITCAWNGNRKCGQSWLYTELKSLWDTQSYPRECIRVCQLWP